jgi:nucleoid-associated protein YgaU
MRFHSPVYRHRRRWWMGRDKVLGLSLAILVVGIAAAFCFRNEQMVESGLKLARANILDEAISKLPGPKPYVQEAKVEKAKPSLPTVTLKGIESVDPFADRQVAAATESDKKAKPIEKSRTSVPVKLAAAEKRVTPPTEMPAIDTRSVTDTRDSRPSDTPPSDTRTSDTRPTSDTPTSSDASTASIDTDKAAPEIKSSKPSAASAFPAEKPSTDPSTLLTSTAPPVTEQPNTTQPSGDSDSPVGEIVIRPNAPSSRKTQPVKDQNVAWQSKPAKEKHDTIADNSADNSPRIEPKSDDSTSDDPHRDECTRNNPNRDVPGVASRTNEEPDKNPIQDTPVAIDPQRDERPAATPPADSTKHEADGSSKQIVHKVRRGDMLTKIALHYLGDSRRYREIFEANRDQLRTPNDRLRIGMLLKIPENTAPAIHHENKVSKRKRSNRTNRSVVGSAGTSKVPIHNAARVHEKPPSEPSEQPPAATSDDQSMNSDTSTTNRFTPVRRAPFLPGAKVQSSHASPKDRPDTMDPATSHRDVPRRAPITLAGDREDATIR